MAICPRGHNSIAEDFCDACGRPIGRQAMPQPQYAGSAPEYAPVPGEPCPVCHTPRDSATRFCEACGYEFDADPGPQYGAGQPSQYPQTDGGQGYAATGQSTGYDYSAGQPPQPDYPSQGGYPDPGGYSTQGGQSGQSGGQGGQGGGHGVHSAPTGHGGRPEQPGYSGQNTGGSGPGQPTAPPGPQQYGYTPQTSAPAGYPPGESYSAGSYQEPSYTDQWGGGTVVGSGPVAVPPRPPMLPADYHPGTAPPATQTGYVWTVRVTADAEYFERVVSQGGPDAHAMRFPPYHETWTVALEGERMRVGRRRAGAAGADVPEIDLSGPPSDPGISHLHVVLMGRQDGSWQLVDPGSTNGTTLNGGKRAIEFNLPVDLHDGDRIHVGAWTTLEVNLRAR
ncbi:FHA domain-containing protein [Streptodolium elevatio]|uniref:FHA domain-containing protein n=1 Tax=Streptodolium elevatio TaxID=3157996 RepID=A0ABV3DVZ9_9ACTN